MKKNIISFLFFTFLFSNIFACSGMLNAQFIGKITNHQKISNQCEFQIDFKDLNPSYECPLVIGAIDYKSFNDKECNLKNGDVISGIVYLNTISGEVFIY